jgi:hypothetical protein
MGARNQVEIGLSYRPASLCSLATQFQTRFPESIPRPTGGLKFSTLVYMGALSDRMSVAEDFPEELAETIKMFHASLTELSGGFEPLLSSPRSDLYERLDPLER